MSLCSWRAKCQTNCLWCVRLCACVCVGGWPHIVLQIGSSLQAGASRLTGSCLEPLPQADNRPHSCDTPLKKNSVSVLYRWISSVNQWRRLRSTDLQLIVIHAVGVGGVELRVVGHIQQLDDQVTGQQLCYKWMLKEEVAHQGLTQNSVDLGELNGFGQLYHLHKQASSL